MKDYLHESRPFDGSHVTGEQVRRLERYVGKVLHALDLGYWKVQIAVDLPPKNALLMIEPTDGRRVAMLYVAEHWMERDAEEKRQDITHECLHLAHHDAEFVIRNFKNDTGDVGTYPLSIVWQHFEIELERMVDSLSYVVAPHMPAWPKHRSVNP